VNALYCSFKFDNFSILFRESHLSGIFGTTHKDRWNNSLLKKSTTIISMMLAQFFEYSLSLSKITYQQISVRISQAFFVLYIRYKFNAQMWKMIII